MILEEIIGKGNRGHSGYDQENKVRCADGFSLSVLAGGGTYCSPRPAFCSCEYYEDGGPLKPMQWEVEHDYPGPYTHVEMGFPSQRPEPWGEWEPFAESAEAPTRTVYGFVPVEMVRALVAAHGGEAG